MNTQELRAYAKQINSRAANFSPQEKVAYKIMDLLDRAHCVEGVVLELEKMLQQARREQDEPLEKKCSRALEIIMR